MNPADALAGTAPRTRVQLFAALMLALRLYFLPR
jgi:hypothetical protein